MIFAFIPLNQTPLQPSYRSTVSEFDGQDPWNNNRGVRWLLAIYRVSPSFRTEKPGSPALNGREDLPDGFALGLFSHDTNQCHLIPYSLARLWRAGTIEIEKLPSLVHRSEMTGSVDRELVRTDTALRVATVLMVSIGLPTLAAGPLLWWFGYRNSGVVCGAVGAFSLSISFVFWFTGWRWRRRQNRFTRQWIRFAQELH